ncbi:MAG: hypothetical protein ACOYOA_11890 [Saprospiraceae bacterium]
MKLEKFRQLIVQKLFWLVNSIQLKNANQVSDVNFVVPEAERYSAKGSAPSNV